MSLSNLLRIGKKAEGLGSQRISTLVIEPAQFSQHSATFLLPKVGVLDAGSFVVLKVKAAEELGLDTIEKFAYDNDHDWRKEYDEMFERLNHQRTRKQDERKSV